MDILKLFKGECRSPRAFMILLAIAMPLSFSTWMALINNFAVERVAFSINHIAAVIVPVTLGFLWLVSPSIVFLVGSVISSVSLVLVSLIPRHPSQKRITTTSFNKTNFCIYK